MTDFAKHAEAMRMVVVDATEDATKVDSTPFTGRGVGEALGGMLAMIVALAKTCEALAEYCEQLEASGRGEAT